MAVGGALRAPPAAMRMPGHPAAALPAWVDPRGAHGDDPLVHVVVETPQGSRHKLAFDEALGLFRVRKVLPVGLAFPYDFGFVPSTRAGDGDPLDVLVLLDGPTAPGVLVEARPIGVIEAEQRDGDDAPPKRNDRVLAVAPVSPRHRDLRTLDDVGARTVEEIERFLVTYQEALGTAVTLLGRGDAAAARTLIAQAAAAYARERTSGG
jgi:inorganic pyrophosphatase